eukprot:gene5292-24200_t
MAVTAACNFKEQERVVARKTFESNNDMCVGFDGIDAGQWILRSRQDRNIDFLDASHDVGVVVTWSPRAEEPWGQIKTQKNGTVHVRLEAVMSGKDKMDTGMVLKFHVTGDGTGRKMTKGDRHAREHAVEVRLDPKGKELKFHEMQGGALVAVGGKAGKGDHKGDLKGPDPGKGSADWGWQKGGMYDSGYGKGDKWGKDWT